MTPAPPAADRMLLPGRLVTPGAVVADGVVAVDGDRIAYAGERTSLPEAWVDLDPPQEWRPGLTLLPGLVDIHCHGGNGGEFGTDPVGARVAAAHHHAHGSTSVIGSLVSAPAAELVAGARTLGELVADGTLAGIHLEGPFLSTVRCGAQDPATLVDADLSLVGALAEAAGPRAFAQMTWAPERSAGQDVPRALAAVGALGALGHTDVDYAGAAAALESVAALGARGGLPLTTHLFNGMPPMHHRSPGPVAAALAAAARGEAVVEVIADGVHLDGGTVRLVYDVVGPDHLALVSDAMAASGLPEGSYRLGGLDVTVSGRAARLTQGGSLAGGLSTVLEQVRWLVGKLGIPLVDAVKAGSTTPARALGLDDVGALEAGRRADVLVVDDELRVERVLRRGAWLASGAT